MIFCVVGLFHQEHKQAPNKTQVSIYMLKDLPEGNTLLAGYFSVVHLAIIGGFFEFTYKNNHALQAYKNLMS